MTENKIIVLIPFLNASNYIIKCVESISEQFYTNYEIFLLDDCSDDGSLELITNDHSYINKIKNDQRLGPLGNICKALTNIPIEEEDIVMIIDGDDYILGEHVFQLINQHYNEGALVTYGQYMDNFGRPGHCRPYTIFDFSNLRMAPWISSHLKTFKYKVFKEILLQDPQMMAFKDKQGNLFTYSSDMALMLPILEISGYHNLIFNENIVYCYRRHPNNENNSREGYEAQKKAEREIRSKKRFERRF